MAILLNPLELFEPSHDSYMYLGNCLPYFEQLSPKTKNALQEEHFRFSSHDKLYKFVVKYHLITLFEKEGVFLVN